MGTKRSTVYVTERPWQSSPEVWKKVAGWIISAFVVGFIACLFVVGNVEDGAKKIGDSKPLKPCSTTAPKSPK
jgi:hypothetical protein